MQNCDEVDDFRKKLLKLLLFVLSSAPKLRVKKVFIIR